MMVWLFLAACSSTAPSKQVVDNTNWGAAKATQSGKYLVTLQNLPEPPAMGELFTLQATVTFADGKPVEKATVKLDARMPQHNHGMETDPIDDPGL